MGALKRENSGLLRRQTPKLPSFFPLAVEIPMCLGDPSERFEIEDIFISDKRLKNQSWVSLRGTKELP